MRSTTRPHPSIPDEYLELSLRSVLALAGEPTRYDDARCDVRRIDHAVRALAERLRLDDDRKRESDRAWLAEQFERLTTALEDV